MTALNWVTFAALVGVVVAPLVTYIVAARRMSGKIATSDASDLWAESALIREDYKDRLTAANDRVTRLETRMADLERENLGLMKKNWELQGKVDEQDAVIVSLKGTISTLETTIKELEGAS